jgi:hypothetical protein
MLRIAALLLCLLLPGCATLTVAAIGGAVALGAISGGAKYGIGESLSRSRTERLISKRCGKLHTDLYRRRCANRLRYILHQYRD